MIIAVSVSIPPSVLGKNKIGFSDLLFDLAWSFMVCSSEEFRRNDLNHEHVFSDFACDFAIIICAVLQFLIHPNTSLL